MNPTTPPPPNPPWKRVSFAADCIGEDQETCSVCGDLYSGCPCPGPTQDGYEYAEIDGVLHARPAS